MIKFNAISTHTHAFDFHEGNPKNLILTHFFRREDRIKSETHARVRIVINIIAYP
jgi:hypothetical protein